MADENKFPGFFRFWEAYGYKLSRKDALRAWAKNKCEDMADEIIAAIPAYNRHLADNPWKQKRNAATWLNAESFYDEYPDAKPAPKPILVSANYGRPEPVKPPEPKDEATIERVRKLKENVLKGMLVR